LSWCWTQRMRTLETIVPFNKTSFIPKTSSEIHLTIFNINSAYSFSICFLCLYSISSIVDSWDCMNFRLKKTWTETIILLNSS
jgi:heme/copper-type cytochrome/quinol oxidase subunit 3